MGSFLHKITAARGYVSEGSPKDVAQLILTECIRTGQSSGWSGSESQRDQIAAMLEPFSVSYVDDMHGIWKNSKYKAPQVSKEWDDKKTYLYSGHSNKDFPED